VQRGETLGHSKKQSCNKAISTIACHAAAILLPYKNVRTKGVYLVIKLLSLPDQITMSVPITISQNIQSGEPVFTNTRVPVKNLFDYLKAGHSLHEFLEDFPSVKKEQAIQVIEHFENLLNFQSSYEKSTA
jgi:uncharacterized protein (DUF433 family)